MDPAMDPKRRRQDVINTVDLPTNSVPTNYFKKFELVGGIQAEI
jgi:hypothetical protein